MENYNFNGLFAMVDAIILVVCDMGMIMGGWSGHSDR